MPDSEYKPKEKKRYPNYKKKGSFPKSLWFDSSKKEYWEGLAAKDGKKLAAFIQDNVGKFSEVEAMVKDAVFQVKAKHKTEGYRASKTEALFQLNEILAFVEALKSK